METNNRKKEGDYVQFNTGVVYGEGYIRGIASIELPIIGATYIIEYTKLSVEYEYSCITLAECMIV